MALIPNFPQDLTDQHHQWHDIKAHPRLGILRRHPMGTTGGGTEFLVFHRDFMAQVFAWYNTTTFTISPFDNPSQKASLVAPWTAVPAEMKALPEYTDPVRWQGDVDRLETGSPNFASEDDLGYFIESRIHNEFLHAAAATAFDEEIVRSLHSPQSTLFYKIHGLVDFWWSKWKRRNIFDLNRPVPGLAPHGDIVFFPDRPVPGLATKAAESSFDPSEITRLIERVKLLESIAFPMHAILEKVVEDQPQYKNS